MYWETVHENPEEEQALMELAQQLLSNEPQEPES